MPLKEITLGKARELVKSGRVEPIQIAGLEGWPDDQRITVPVKDEPAPAAPPTSETVPAGEPAPQGSQEEGSQAPAEESPA